jgi:DNA-binding CsgD family transcriptional regulator/preprotein translocase subunit SecG
MFVFMLAAVLTMFLAIMSVLFFTGAISVNDEKTAQTLHAEHQYLHQDISRQFGDVSVRAILLSENISAVAEELLEKKGLQAADLQNHPDVLNELLSASLYRLLFALDSTNCSGVFLTLNATVNPSLPEAAYSRAGLYIREAEPSVAGSVYNKLFLRGPQELAIRNGMTPQAKWELEFNVKNRPFYEEPLAAYRENPSFVLSRLYYWSIRDALPYLNDNVLLCSIPIICANGQVLGVCGFEISGMHFRLNNDSRLKSHDRTIAFFSAADETGIYLKPALYAGNAVVYKSIAENEKMFLPGNWRGQQNIYQLPNNTDRLSGFHSTINMYAVGSPFAQQSFVLVTAMPQEDVDAMVREKNTRLAFILLVCLIFGVIISVFLSRQHMDPLLERFDDIFEATGSDKTNIPEIDELVAKIKAAYGNNSAVYETLVNDFIERAATLTPTELVIFQHYAEGKTFEEIKSLMFIATGTLKTHNTHIYKKLNVSSKDVLLFYIELIKRSGNYQKLFR